MKKSHLFLVAGALVAGCNSDPVNVGTNPVDAATSDGSTSDARVDAVVDAGGDTGAPDVTTQDTGTDTGPADTGPTDTGSMEDAGTDTGPTDTGPPDTGPIDAGPLDARPMDSGTDTGPADTGPADTGPADTGPTDTGPATDACVATTETCNGRDDDCDGAIDENGCGTHLLITEFAALPDEAEMVEIYNPTSTAIDLSNVYLSDVNTYACVVTRNCLNDMGAVTTPSVTNSDFVARFPAGAMIGPGQYRTIALNHPAEFNDVYGRCPDFHLPRSSPMVGTCTASTVMRTARDTASNVGSSSGLTNTGEPVILFQWTEGADRVTDIDVVVFGSPTGGNVGPDKTALRLMTSGGTAMYQPDTAVASQSRSAVNSNGGTTERCDYSEGTETRTGGNGVGGHDETSENAMATFRARSPAAPVDGGIVTVNGSPGAASTCN